MSCDGDGDRGIKGISKDSYLIDACLVIEGTTIHSNLHVPCIDVWKNKSQSIFLLWQPPAIDALNSR